MAIGLALNYVGLDAVGILFWRAVLNGVSAPPLVLLVVLLTSDPKAMGDRTNPSLLRGFDWITLVVVVAAAGMFATS